MKAKYLWAILLTTLIFAGCDDNTGSLGLDMLPGSDKISVRTATFDVTTESFLSGPVFARTSTGYVGKFTDLDFGYYEAGFLTQLNCTENFKFLDFYDPETKTGILAGDSLRDIRLELGYSQFFGDSLNASRMSVYQLDKRLDQNHYTNVIPENYYDENDPEALLGRKAYTAVDLSINDSIRKADGNMVSFTLSKEFGMDIYRKNKSNPEFFKDANAFIENVFKGIYVKNDYGDGTILYVDRVDLVFEFNVHYVDSTGAKLLKANGNDSIYKDPYIRTFSATREVIQANRFTNDDQLETIAQQEEHTYLKSPAGIFTRAKLPIKDIYNQLSTDTLNAVKLTFTGYQQKTSTNAEFQMNAPSHVLLLREKDVKTFFESNSLPDNITSYLASANGNKYEFTNLSRLIKACIDEKETVRKEEGANWTEAEWEAWEEENMWENAVLIPVSTLTDSNNSIIGIQHDMSPSYVKLQGGPEAGNELTMEVYYTVFHE